MAAKNKILQTVVEIAGNVNPSLGSAVQGVLGQLEKINLKGLAVAGAVGGAVMGVAKLAVQAGKYLVNLGSQFDDAQDAIRIGTGATGEALDALMSDFEEVYKSVPTSMEDASKAIADYNTRLGLTGDTLQGLSVQAIQVAGMLGDDLDSVIESSSKAFQQWGLDAEDMGAAMDYVFKASQSTGAGFSDLMGDLQSYGAQFQQMGYSFQEATAMIGQLEKAGVNTSEVLAGMKKSISTLADHGISAADGLSMYVDAIKNAKDMTNATALAAEAFGTRAASTMAAAIRDGTFDIDALTAALEANQETIAGCAAETYDFAEQLQIFKQQAEVALKPLAAELFAAINKLMPVVAKLMDSLIPIIDEMVAILTPIIDDVVTQLIPILEQLMTPLLRIAKSLLTKIIPPLMKIVMAILPVVVQLVELIGDILDPIFDMLGSVLPIIAELIAAVMQILSKLLAKILPFIEKILAAILPILTDIIEAVLPILIDLLDALMPILDLVLDLLDPILDIIVSIVAPILKLISTALKPIITVIQTLISKALQPLQPLIEMISGLLTGTLGAALNAITPIIEMITNVFGGLMDFIGNVFTGNWAAAWDNIKGIFEGIWNGVVGFFKGIINGIITIVETGINAIIKVINGITSAISSVWTWTGIPGIPAIPLVSLPRLATGGFTEGVSIAGEEGMEAVISFDPAYRQRNIETWEAAGKLLGVVGDLQMADGAKAATYTSIQMLEMEASRNEQPQLAQAGKLLSMDDFSLGGLTETHIIYYDFSGFTWAPQVAADNEAKTQDLMEALKDNAAEFFDWLEEWLKLKEVGNFGRVSIY
ncbi:phage tail tape measure protein [uncultured Alistipes sp.]|uniref:phage tail tape measure protein n=1 Tax=uncultured Alistipes sp. TaxID=538949 RepID=UPI00265B4FCD|nr:phage tail tape measure protein [uncultured Alistipes sp.]